MTIEGTRHWAQHNWSRWGEDDQRGAPNLLSADRVVAGAGLVRRGMTYQLGRQLGARTAVPPLRDHPRLTMNRHGGSAPMGRTRVIEFADDEISMATHTATHIDAPAHIWYGGQLYNGFPSSSVTSEGAARCGVEHLGPLVGRGVLIDAAADGPVPDGTAITVTHLERCLARQRVRLRMADVVLVRTGWWDQSASDPDTDWRSEPGLDLEAAEWLAQCDPAVVGADNVAFEVLPADAGGGRAFPVHELLLRDCGVPIIEGLDLDALAADGVYEFLFVAAPLALVGATASPVNPVAVV